MYGPGAPSLQVFPGSGFLLTFTVTGLGYLLTCLQQNIPMACSVTTQVTICFVLIWLQVLNYILLYHDKEYLRGKKSAFCCPLLEMYKKLTVYSLDSQNCHFPH